LTNKHPYKFLAKVLTFLFILGGSLNSNGQVFEKEILDTLPTLSLEQALKEDPLKVYKLSLRKNKLKEFPEEVYQFKNLQVLDISKNKISYFPRKLTVFSYLQELNFSNNNISSIPKEIGKIPHLKKLILNQNKLTSLPPEISQLNNLVFLDVWGNDIGFLPAEITKLKETLKEIDMRVILMSNEEHKKIQDLLPDTKIHFSKSCNCGF